MRCFCQPNPIAQPAALLLMLLGVVLAPFGALAGDLPAAGDGEHLWLIEQAPAPEGDDKAKPRLILYHLPADTERYQAIKLDPIEGELMPRGVAAGDGRLLLATKDRQLITIRPVWSELLMQWVYQKRTVTALPEGCTLVSLAMGDRGPWALVQVESRELLDRLDQPTDQADTPTDQQMLNRALGLPEDLRWDEPETPSPKQDETPADAEGDDAPPAQTDETEAARDTQPEPEGQAEASIEPELPAYRLIQLRRSKWVRSPLPEDFEMPGKAELLLRPGEDRPTLLLDSHGPRQSTLIRYNPVVQADRPEDDGQDGTGDTPAEADGETEPAQAPAWNRLSTGMTLPPGRQWSAQIVNGQIVIALERFRPQQVVTIDTFRLRGTATYAIGYCNVSVGDNARWALCAKHDEIALFASPAPPPTEKDATPPLAMLVGMSLDGEAMFENEQGQPQMMPIVEKRPGRLQGNADLFVQILAFITAMFMMVMFYRRAPQQDQLDLPDHLVLASFGRRAMAGMIDLTPGFLLASLIYDVSVSETVFQAWPGNGIEKAFAAMRPGFLVIGVTLVHTTIAEFILARSLGKVMMGMYVADLRGKPAAPLPCLGRSLSRAFELFAPLMILVAVISPARQRLGDILAKTTVVMRKPEPIQFDEEE